MYYVNKAYIMDEGGKWKGESLISDVQILLLILFNFFFHQSHSQ